MGTIDPTLYYGWDLPLDAGSTDTWGTELNTAIGEQTVALILGIDGVLALVQVELDAVIATITNLDQRTTNLEGARAEPHYARLGPPVTITSSTTASALDWPTTAQFDVSSDTAFYDSATAERVTVPKKGGYNISAQITVPTHRGNLDGNDDKFGWELTLHKNAAGTPMATMRTPRTTNGSDSKKNVDETLRVAVIDSALAGDYYEVRLRRYGAVKAPASSNLIRAASDHFEIYQMPSPGEDVLATMQWSTPMLVGRWARLGEIDAEMSGGAVNLAAGNVYYRPVAVYRKVVLDQCSFGLRTASTGEQNARVGIYQAQAANAFPGALMGQTADMVFNGSAKADYTATFESPITLLPNVLYWMAIAQYDVSGGGTFQLEGVSGAGESIGAHLGWESPQDALPGATQADFMLRAGIGASVVGTKFSNQTTDTQHTVELPPQARVDGQILVINFNVRANSAITPPGGWTLVLDAGATSTVTDGVVVFRRISASEAGGGSVLFVSSLNRTSASVAYLIDGSHLTEDPEAVVVEQDATQPFGERFNPPAITPSWGPTETLLIAVAAPGTSDDVLLGVPGGYTEDGEVDGAAGDQSCAAAHKAGVATTEDAGNFVYDGNSSGLAWAIAVSAAQTGGISGALPDPATLVGRAFVSGNWPGISVRIDELP